MILNGEVQELLAFPYIAAVKFWFPMTIAGVFGFLMGYVVGLQIQVNILLNENLAFKHLS